MSLGIRKEHAGLKPIMDFVQQYYANKTKEANGTLESSEDMETTTKIDTSGDRKY